MTLVAKETPVFVIGPDSAVREIFSERGFPITTDFDESKIVCWTGGADIHPKLYGQEPIRDLWLNTRRDDYEVPFFKKAEGKFKAGICRGGQLLNALSGGSMWQDVTNHVGKHYLKDVLSSKSILVTSLHHQMMRPHPTLAEILATSERRSERYEDENGIEYYPKEEDVEVCWYPSTRSLCYQPHPEGGLITDTNYFFSLIERLY